MINNVYIRRREIYVYASLGLSPIGAALMFLVESIIYSVIASVIGYLIGYGLISLLFVLGIQQFSYNVSSIFVIASLTAIMLACIASTIYPSIIAAKLITPSLERKWKPPTKPQGDLWELPLPIKIKSKEEILGIFRYLREYYLGLGAIRPGFRVLKVSSINHYDLSMIMDVILTPTELGIRQSVKIQAIQQKDRTFSLAVFIERISGDYDQWKIRNYYFFDDVRKQLLLWRALPSSEKRKYISKV